VYPSLCALVFSARLPPPTSTLFPYTTLFRSCGEARRPRPALLRLAVWRPVPVDRRAHPAYVHTVRAYPGRRPRLRGDHRSDSHRSEEHTSELQSRENLVCRLLLEKKKKQTHT